MIFDLQTYFEHKVIVGSGSVSVAVAVSEACKDAAIFNMLILGFTRELNTANKEALMILVPSVTLVDRMKQFGTRSFSQFGHMTDLNVIMRVDIFSQIVSMETLRRFRLWLGI
jgi:hypothetical protein